MRLLYGRHGLSRSRCARAGVSFAIHLRELGSIDLGVALSGG